MISIMKLQKKLNLKTLLYGYWSKKLSKLDKRESEFEVNKSLIKEWEVTSKTSNKTDIKKLKIMRKNLA